jgi:hypothetical protein
MILTITIVSSAALASPVVYVDNQYQPSQIAANQGGYYHRGSIRGLTWAQWNQPVASGQGTYSFQFCLPDSGPCADAAFYDTPALVKLSGIVTCRGRAAYTKLEVTPDGSQPNTLYKPFQVKIDACRSRRTRSRRSVRRHRGK